MTDGKYFFDQPIRDNIITHNNRKYAATAQGDDYKFGCLLDYLHSKETLS